MATGVPPPAAPFEERPEGEGDEDGLDAGVARQAGDRAADDVELAGLHGDVVQQHGVEDRPADGQQAEARAVDERHARPARTHAEGGDGHDQGDRGGRRPGAGGQPAARHEQVEEHEDGQRGEEGRDDDRAERERVGERVESLLVQRPEHGGRVLGWDGRKDMRGILCGRGEIGRGNGGDVSSPRRGVPRR